jgi:release factor glutamine methyltransferase
MTWGELLDQGAARLRRAGIRSPQLDASLLLAHILGINREKLLIHGDRVLKKEPCSLFFDLIERRIAGASTACLTGTKEFWGLPFTVSPAVLVPRPDTEILVEAVLDYIREIRGQTSPSGDRAEQCAPGEPLSLLDLCTGSGAVAIALKTEMPELRVFASDISPEALEIARINARKLLPGGQDIVFYLSDLYAAIPVTAGLIVANPPYIPAGDLAKLPPEVRAEPRIALDGGKNGLDLIKAIISGAGAFLETGGGLFLEADPGQMPSITLILKDSGFQNIQLYKDLAGRERVISGKKNG